MEFIFQKPGDGQCLNACLASLMGVSLKDAPRIRYPYEMDNSGPYVRRVRKFLAKHGYGLMGFKNRPEIYAGVPYIACGDSPRPDEDMHAVIKIGRRIVHDPHPSGAGIVGHWFSWVVVPLFQEK